MKERGIALITVLITASLLFTCAASFLLLVTQSRYLNERFHENMVALHLAEAGADYAMWEIIYGGADFTGWGGTNPKTLTITDFQDGSGNIYGDINIEVYSPGTSNMAVVSRGSMTSYAGPDISKSIQLLVKQSKVFENAILSATSISMAGNAHVDSYDSTDGDYGGPNKDDNGNIVTNGTGDPAIGLQGNAEVEGDANTGEGGTIVTQGNSDITGDEDHDADETLYDVTVPTALQNLSSEGDFSLSDNDSELITGDHKYGSLDLSGNADLTLSGDVRIYVTGDITTDGNTDVIINYGSNAKIYHDGNVNISSNSEWNTSQNPADLQFYGTTSVSTVTCTGNAEIRGALYAPSANIYLQGNADICGAVIGNTVSMEGNANIHYDEEFANETSAVGYKVYAWQEK